MAGIPSILPLGEGFAVYRETTTAHIFVLINEDYPFSLYVVTPREPDVSEDIMEVGLVIVPDKPVGIDSV